MLWASMCGGGRSSIVWIRVGLGTMKRNPYSAREHCHPPKWLQSSRVKMQVTELRQSSRVTIQVTEFTAHNASEGSVLCSSTTKMTQSSRAKVRARSYCYVRVSPESGNLLCTWGTSAHPDPNPPPGALAPMSHSRCPSGRLHLLGSSSRSCSEARELRPGLRLLPPIRVYWTPPALHKARVKTVTSIVRSRELS